MEQEKWPLLTQQPNRSDVDQGRVRLAKACFEERGVRIAADEV
jgi:hypothetical protein